MTNTPDKQLEKITSMLPPLPKKYQGNNLDTIIVEATDAFFFEKYLSQTD
ncbi:MAG: hypothetical protein WCO52_05725 [bacterium]